MINNPERLTTQTNNTEMLHSNMSQLFEMKHQKLTYIPINKLNRSKIQSMDFSVLPCQHTNFGPKCTKWDNHVNTNFNAVIQQIINRMTLLFVLSDIKSQKCYCFILNAMYETRYQFCVVLEGVSMTPSVLPIPTLSSSMTIRHRSYAKVVWHHY